MVPAAAAVGPHRSDAVVAAADADAVEVALALTTLAKPSLPPAA